MYEKLTTAGIIDYMEEQLGYLDEGMIANIILTEEMITKNARLGVVHNISEEQKDVTFNEEVEQDGLLQGYHAVIEVILQESLGTTVVDKNVVHENIIQEMRPAGKLNKQMN